MLGDQPVGGSEFDAGLPLLFADSLAYGRCIECIANCHAVLQTLTIVFPIRDCIAGRASGLPHDVG